jgi:hypothetical protein
VPERAAAADALAWWLGPAQAVAEGAEPAGDGRRVSVGGFLFVSGESKKDCGTITAVSTPSALGGSFWIGCRKRSAAIGKRSAYGLKPREGEPAVAFWQ